MSQKILVSTRKGLFELQRSAAGWQISQRAFLGEQVSMALRDPHDGKRYAALNLGHFGVKLHRSDNEGKDWQEVTAPSYEEIPAPEAGGDAPSLKLIWSLAAGVPGTLWAGTIPGGLFKSTDAGASWELCRNLWDNPLRSKWFGGGYDEPGIHSICVDPRNPEHITLAISCGGIWQSFDNGATWNATTKGMRADYMPPDQQENPEIQDPHCLVQCASDPDRLWVQHHNGIFISSNGGNQWESITGQPTSFGFAVAVHPKDPDTAWFVPAIKDEYRYPQDARFVVSKTEDGGKTFRILDKGLPAQESYDLVYRHGLAVDATGDCLVMGSTTGNLWVSENGGESWELLSAHLPPVFAVSFI